MSKKSIIDRMGIASLFFLLVITGCDDIFEKDLSNESVELRSPNDNSEVVESAVTFWWNKLEGATGYNLQIVSPEFGKSQTLILDSILFENKFELALEPGKYQWGIMALNSVSQTDLFTRAITIAPVYNLSLSQVILLFPENGFVSRNSQIHFSWDALPHANNYTLKIKKGTWATGVAIFENNLSANKLITTLEDGDYVWGVCANDTVNKKSTPFNVRELTVDKNAPSTPILKYPAKDSVIQQTEIEFSWLQTEIQATYQFQVFDQADVNEPIIDKEINDTTCFVKFAGDGKYYWKVRAIDKASNIGPYSALYPFTIKKSPPFSERKVEVIIPGGGAIIKEKQVSFLWNLIDGATRYHIQIVSPSFTNPERLLLDEWVETNKYTANLAGGLYEARIMATDGNSQTDHTTVSFSVNNQALSIPVLVSPRHRTGLSDFNITFNWQNADETDQGELSYVWELSKVDNGTTILMATSKTTSNSFSYSFASGGTFQWRVKAVDQAGNTSAYSSIWEFYLEEIPDISGEIVGLLAPADYLNTSVKTLNFWWNHLAGAEKYVFQIVSPNFNNIQILVEDKELTENKVTVDLPQGNYQWRVRAINSKSVTAFSTRTLIIEP